MSIVAESIAEINSKKLEEILRKGKEKNNPEITSFLKSEVYSLYLSEVRETFGLVKEDKELRDYYFSK